MHIDSIDNYSIAAKGDGAGFALGSCSYSGTNSDQINVVRASVNGIPTDSVKLHPENGKFQFYVANLIKGVNDKIVIQLIGGVKVS